VIGDRPALLVGQRLESGHEVGVWFEAIRSVGAVGDGFGRYRAS